MKRFNLTVIAALIALFDFVTIAFQLEMSAVDHEDLPSANSENML